MRFGRAALLILCASGCVNITVNDKDGTGGANGTITGGATGRTSGAGTGCDAGADSCGAYGPPRATDNVTLRGNLDQTAPVLTWDPVNPKTSSDFTTSVAVYDSLGMAIQLDIYFSKNDRASTQSGDSGDWSYHVMTDGANLAFAGDGITPTVPGMPTEVADGTLRFDTVGRLISSVASFEGFYPKDAEGPQALSFNFGTGTLEGGNGLDGMAQYAATSAISFVSQSGWPAVAP
jgi:flagellar hook protein FlgE